MKRLWVVIVLLFGMVSVSLILAPANGMCAEPIKIGVVLDISSAHAEAGRSQLDGIKMVFDEVNEKGGILGHKIEYLIGDEKASPDRAASLAKRFIEVDKVLLIEGMSTSSAGLAVIKIATEAEIPVVGQAYSVKLHEGEFGKWWFGSSTNNEEYCKAWLNMVQKDGFKEAGLLWVNYAWGRDAKDTLYKFSKDYGVRIVGDVPVEMGASEATAEVARMKEMNPKAVICPLLTKDQAAVCRAFVALNWKPERYAGGPIVEPALKMVGPELMEGWKGQFHSNAEDPNVKALLDRFKAKYGKNTEAPLYLVEMWNATNALVKALKTMIENREPLTGSKVRDALEKYTAGTELAGSPPRKTKGWATKPPHILVRAEDHIFMVVKGGKIVPY